jgi:hypothetical protein
MADPLLQIGDEVKDAGGNWHKIIAYSSRFCGHNGEVPCYTLHDKYTWPIKTCDSYAKSNPDCIKRK